MSQLKLTADILSAALEGFEARKHRINTRIAEIRKILDGGPSHEAVPDEAAPPRKKRSAAARRKMALAQKARWAKVKQSSAPQPAPPETAKPKRKLSAAARKRIAAAQKKRWAAIKAKSPKERS